MANLDRIAKVNIDLKTTPITEAGFNTILVAGMHVNKLGSISVYTDIDGLPEDGFKEDSEIYKAVKSAFMQTPKPSFVKVGKIKCDSVEIEVLNAVVDAEYKITVQSLNDSYEVVSSEYKYTATAIDTVATIANELKTAIESDTVLNPIATDSTLTLSNKTTGKDFAITVSDNLKITGLTKGLLSIGENLSKINSTDSNWYGLVYASHKVEDILEVADWTEAKNKIFGTSTNENGAKSNESTTDLGSKLKEKNYLRTHWWYHDKSDEYIESAILTSCFSYNPGSETWANKKLSGISSDGLTESEYQAIKAKNGNTFESFGSFSITQNGKMAGGEWIDVIRFRDWLQSKMQTNIVSVLINSPKIPYTDGGINIISSQVQSTLKEGQNVGGIAPTEYLEDGTPNPGYVMSVPLASNISSNDKANRNLKNVRFSARLAGAIHVAEISGAVTYENLI